MIKILNIIILMMTLFIMSSCSTSKVKDIKSSALNSKMLHPQVAKRILAANNSKPLTEKDKGKHICDFKYKSAPGKSGFDKQITDELFDSVTQERKVLIFRGNKLLATYDNILEVSRHNKWKEYEGAIVVELLGGNDSLHVAYSIVENKNLPFNTLISTSSGNSNYPVISSIHKENLSTQCFPVSMFFK